MKTTALLLLFLLCAGLNNSFAQIKEGDLLISRPEYTRMKKELAICRFKTSQLDSLEMAYNALIKENELLFSQFSDKLDREEQRIIKLQTENRKLNLVLKDQKAKTNEYRYAYQHSGRFKERAKIATVWASLMSVGFIMAAGDNHQAAYILGAGSAALTIYLSLKSDRASRNAPSL